MQLGKMKVNIEFVGAEKLHEAIDDVKKKAEELEQAIQRLNEIKLELKTQIADALEKPTTVAIGDEYEEDRRKFPHETYADYIDRLRANQ
ncbi:hypothetical protein [Streptococcus iners]|uniref:Uncharacterized protein n=1 Tax=Streptococcus iners TaxID=3028084 RepID=A0AA96VUH6_9STRE|nr:hypothetical protein [Streptococcus sp. 29887]MCK4026688.1 hypothetical protein [Streptococcus suis]WNY51494.1 hypothetical protein PW252_02200 [Streptococcus sp. 29887]